MSTNMLIDTHCHLNMMIKKSFDILIESNQFHEAQNIINQAHQSHVTTIINVGTSLTESLNCVELAKKFDTVFATVGIHPNDCTQSWHDDVKKLAALVADKEKNKIVGIGECGIDMHYPDYNLARQT